MSAARERIERLIKDGIDMSAENVWPNPINITALANTEPQPPNMLIDDWLPAGYATLLAGHGGIGKSAIALNLSVCMATGLPFFGLPVKQRRVLYLSCEDRQEVLHWRLARICNHMSVDMAGLAKRLDILDLVGTDAVLWQRLPYQEIATTPAYNALCQTMRDHSTDVLVVDGVSDVFGGNENNRGEVKQFVNSLVALVPPETGAVLLVAHVNKPTAQGMSSEGYSGSTGWHNSVRARWYLYPETERTDEGTESTGKLRLELQKSNLGRSDQAMLFGWSDDAHLFVGELEADPSKFDRNQRDNEEREGILKAIAEIYESGDYVPIAAQGPRTAHSVLREAESFPESLVSKASKRRFLRHVEHLRRNGYVREGSIRRANRHLVATLELKPAQEKGCADASYSF